MRALFCFCIISLLAVPLPALANCKMDFDKASDDMKAEGLAPKDSPRAKALLDKASLAAGRNDEKTCAETVKGLNQLLHKD